MIHLECCETAASFLLQLFHHIKDIGAMQHMFGKYIHVTESLTADACGQYCTLLRRMAQLSATLSTCQLAPTLALQMGQDSQRTTQRCLFGRFSTASSYLINLLLSSQSYLGHHPKHSCSGDASGSNEASPARILEILPQGARIQSQWHC